MPRARSKRKRAVSSQSDDASDEIGANGVFPTKSEPVEVKKEEEPDELGDLLSFTDRLEDWRKLPSSDQYRLMRKAFAAETPLRCLSRHCDATLSTVGGMKYHLAHCSAKETQKSAIATPNARVVMNPKEIHEMAVAEFQSYQDKLDDWRKLSDADQSRILRYTYMHKKQAWSCLNSSCSVTLNTYNGLLYHMKRCGLPNGALGTKCHKCGASVPKWQFAGHLQTHKDEKKRERAKQRASASNKTSDQEDASSSDLSDDDSDHGSRRARYRVATLPLKDYRERIATIQECFRKQHYILDPEVSFDLLSDANSNSWTPVALRDIDSHLPYLKESVRFYFDTDSKDKKTIKKYEVVTTEIGYLGFCGGAITVVAWCPVDPGMTTDQYVLVAIHNDVTMNVNDADACGVFQLWSINADQTNFRLCAVIAHNLGAVMDLKWCPSGVWQRKLENSTETNLGAVAASSNCGEIGIYLIPTSVCAMHKAQVQYYHPTPFLRLYCGASKLIYALDWYPYKGHDKIVGAVADGSIALWRISDRKSPLLKDDDNRILPYSCIEVANGPVRKVRWWSETKVIVWSLDRQISLWDIVENCLILKLVSGHVATFECDSSYLNGIAHSMETSASVPQVALLNFLIAGGRSAASVCAYHSAVVWAISLNMWTGECLTADDNGMVCRSCCPCTDKRIDGRKKYFDEVVMKTEVETLDHEIGDDAVVYDYAEAKVRCCMKFDFQVSKVTRTQTEKEFKNVSLSGRFPLPALYAASWSPNRSFSNWCCLGGQAGFLHLIRFDDK